MSISPITTEVIVALNKSGEKFNDAWLVPGAKRCSSYAEGPPSSSIISASIESDRQKRELINLIRKINFSSTLGDKSVLGEKEDQKIREYLIEFPSKHYSKALYLHFLSSRDREWSIAILNDLAKKSTKESPINVELIGHYMDQLWELEKKYCGYTSSSSSYSDSSSTSSTSSSIGSLDMVDEETEFAPEENVQNGSSKKDSEEDSDRFDIRLSGLEEPLPK